MNPYAALRRPARVSRIADRIWSAWTPDMRRDPSNVYALSQADAHFRSELAAETRPVSDETWQGVCESIARRMNRTRNGEPMPCPEGCRNGYHQVQERCTGTYAQHVMGECRCSGDTVSVPCPECLVTGKDLCASCGMHPGDTVVWDDRQMWCRSCASDDYRACMVPVAADPFERFERAS
jgi:hypothetical protein